jgi:CheY-like chemotaxis protein
MQPAQLREGVVPVLVIAAAATRLPIGVLHRRGYHIVLAESGARMVECIQEAAPDAIVVDGTLPDMSGLDACSWLHAQPLIGYRVPILLLAPEPASPDQRVSILRAGAWDVLSPTIGAEELVLRLDTYIQAKRNLDIALGDRTADPVTSIHSRASLARRARELGALMGRKHGALATIVFAVEGVPAIPLAHLALGAIRMSDAVGVLGATEVAVLAPATDHAGAASLARRVAGVMRAHRAVQRIEPGATLWVGYDAVASITYTPLDPIELISRATIAVRYGIPESNCPWVRRFGGGAVSEEVRALSSRTSPIQSSLPTEPSRGATPE